MHVVAEKSYFLHTILQLGLGRRNPQTIYKPPEGVTNMNDGFFIDAVKLKISTGNGFYNPQSHICKVLHMIMCQNYFYIVTAGSHLGLMQMEHGNE